MITKQELEYLYWQQEMTLAAIAKLKNCSYGTIHKYMELHGIPRRKLGRQKGTRLSRQHRRRISESKKGSLNPNFGQSSNSPKRYWYERKDGEVVSMRSRWEVAYARYLDHNDGAWEYEPQTFILSNGSSYTPDFYLSGDHVYVEIKGWLTPSSQKKIDEFKASHKLRLLLKNDLINLGINLTEEISSAPWPQNKCENCEQLFPRKYKKQKFCCNQCKNKWIANNKSTNNPKVLSGHKRSYRGSQQGQNNNGSKLNESDVYNIFAMRENGATLKEIAESKSISIGNVGNVLHGRSWKHISRK